MEVMEAVQHSPSEIPGDNPGQGVPALSGGAGRSGKGIGRPVSQLARTTGPAHPA